MRKNLMPQARQLERPQGLQWDISPQALQRWGDDQAIAARATTDSISILEPIGSNLFTGEGFTDKKMAGILRSIGADKDVTVYVNSPGGSLSQGVAIYEMLRMHSGHVTIKVLYMAASAASIIAMAGDEIQIAKSGFLMIHNAFVEVVGNRNDLRDVADELEPFDLSMAEIYATRTKIELKAIQKKMDAETYINGTAAVDEGWADALLPADEIEKESARTERPAAYKIDELLAKAGTTRSERRALIQEFRSGTLRAAEAAGTPSATEDDMPGAVVLPQLISVIEGFSLPA